VKTPNLDRLAARGTVFTRSYCQQAVCSPSRSSLLTGRRPDATKVWDLDTHFRAALPDAVTLPQHFKANGYHTAAVSKVFHRGYEDGRSWSEPHWYPNGQTVDTDPNDSTKRIVKKYGTDVLTRILELLSNEKFTHWFGNTSSLRADMIGGLALYIHEFERPGFIHSAMTEHMLHNTTPTLIENLAAPITKPIASEVFNRVMCPAAKDLGSEDGRAVKTCTALVKQVAELFKERNKPQTDYLPRFKAAFELFYTDADTREAHIIGIRKFCSNKGLPDYWWAKKNNGLTR